MAEAMPSHIAVNLLRNCGTSLSSCTRKQFQLSYLAVDIELNSN